MTNFKYLADAELFSVGSWKSCGQHVRYRRFALAAEAMRFRSHDAATVTANGDGFYPRGGMTNAAAQRQRSKLPIGLLATLR
jgi:hypothetical protein